MSRQSRFHAATSYSALRARARADATLVLAATGVDLPADLHTSNINAAALAVCDKWSGRRVPWSWSGAVRQYRGIPARFELAIWVGDRLCGLALGSPSKSDLHCAIVYLEGGPEDESSLRGLVFLVATTHLEVYARFLGKREARVVGPANDKIVALAKAVGYDFIKAPKGQDDYCVKEIGENASEPEAG